MKAVGEHAVVLGAGVAGLLAARVLSDFYDSVSVVERDVLPDHPAHRGGTPQDRHLHNLLGRGTQILAELFPGLIDEMSAAGAVVVADGDLSRMYARVGDMELKRSGHMARPVTLCLSSRAFTEFHIRRRVAALPKVTFLDGYNVVEPLTEAGTVTGARIVNRSNGSLTELESDLVVDASGRSARTPAFLEALGYTRPPETRSASTLGYSSQRLKIPPGELNQVIVMFNRGLGRPGGVLMACEHDTWMLAIGRSADNGGAPADFATMLAVAAEFLPATIADPLRRAEPVGEIAMLRNPAAIWRHYDQMSNFPRGLLVVGDGVCSLNPIYGQGMTMSALQALTLRDCLRKGKTDLAQRFFVAAAQQIGPTWARNQTSDHPPSLTRKRSLGERLLGKMIRATANAAAYDATVAERLLRVAHLIDPPSRMRDPALLLRVLVVNTRETWKTYATRSFRRPESLRSLRQQSSL